MGRAWAQANVEQRARLVHEFEILLIRTYAGATARIGTQTVQGSKIYDVNVLGVWLIQTYRHQFADLVAQRGIAALLDFLAERNRQLGAQSRS